MSASVTLLLEQRNGKVNDFAVQSSVILCCHSVLLIVIGLWIGLSILAWWIDDMEYVSRSDSSNVTIIFFTSRNKHVLKGLPPLTTQNCV